MPARGIIGRKPIIGTSAAYSDVFSCGYQYDVSSTSTWPSSSSGTGEFVVIHTDYTNSSTGNLFTRYRKSSDGRYYPAGTIDKVNRIASEAVVSGSVTPGARYVAVATEQYIDVYKLNTTEPKVSDYTWILGITVASSVSTPIWDIEFDPSGTYLAVVQESPNTSSPFFRIWKRSGDSFSEITPITQPLTGSLYTGRSISWNHDGSSVAIGFSTSPYLAIYNRSGDTFTKLATPSTIPTAVVVGLAWNHNGSSLAILPSSAVARVYNRSGDTFTSVASWSLTGTGTQVSAQISWNYNGTLLAMPSNQTSPTSIAYNNVYSRSGDTFTNVSAPNGWSNSGSLGCIFMPDGKELIMAHSARGEIFNVSGTTVSRPYGFKLGYFSSTTVATTGPTPYLGDAYATSGASLQFNWAAEKIIPVKGL